MLTNKITFKDDVELIDDEVVKGLTKSYVKSIMSKLYKFFITKPYLSINDKTIEIKIIAKARANIVFYNNKNKPNQELLEKIGYVENKYFIGIRSLYKNENNVTVDCLEWSLQTGALKSNFRTELNGYIIIGNLYLDKDSVTHTDYGTVESEEDPTIQAKRLNDSQYEGLYEEYSNHKLTEAKQHEESLGESGVPVYLNRKELRLTCIKNGINSSYPRLLLERKIGRMLNDDEDCDHIDGNTLNNEPDNLRPLLSTVNASFSNKEKKRVMTEEHKDNLRIAKIGYRPPDESIRKMREARDSYVYTPEVRERMSSGIKNSRRERMLNDEPNVGKGKLTLSQVTYYRQQYESGQMSKRDIINETGVNESTVSRFLTYVTFNVH